MSTQLLEILPRELKFIFEVKKQSSCGVRLSNNSYHYVAFKVKTTSPKKYCVRPNVGIILPKSTCEFTVTMQAPKVALTDMVCKDKFLIQSTVVPVGTTDKDIAPNMFNKENDKYIEEIKLKVALINRSESPVLSSPINGVLNQAPFFEASVLKDPVLSRVENTSTPLHMVEKDVEFNMMSDQNSKIEKDMELKPKKDLIDFLELKPKKDFIDVPELKPKKDLIDLQELKPAKNVELMQNNNVINGVEANLVNGAELKPENNVIIDKLAKDTEFPSPKNAVKDGEFAKVGALKELKLVSDIEEMKSKLSLLESKLNEAESTISKLTEERRFSIQERKILREELDVLKSRTSERKLQVGFPLLFVVMVALICIFLGYLSHP